MTFNANSRRTMTGIAIAAAAVALPSIAQAQVTVPMGPDEVQTLPPEYQTGPALQNGAVASIGADGVETITRTRRIESTVAYPGAAPTHEVHTEVYETEYGHGYAQAPAHHGYAPAGYAPATAVFERDQWLDECERRTNGRGNGEKGGIIGGLLGAIAGGIIGNRAFDSERLGGTLLGAGVGGLGGALLGSIIGGGRDDRGNYDCEAALDGYISQYGYGGHRIATRAIPAPAYQTYAPAPQGYYAHAPAYHHQYTYAPPQQVVYVPVQVYQQQRVVVRETVREEYVPGAARTVPAPAPVALPAPRPAPRPAPPRYVKGN
ncbi:hypothetical protein [Erythrobacter sp. Alg231-14]|uniref:hypothetical protein n=1 Tax=Erythrobacter sp. Alg231-14 TaxID=1922225 RepID=UPI000D55063C